MEQNIATMITIQPQLYNTLIFRIVKLRSCNSRIFLMKRRWTHRWNKLKNGNWATQNNCYAWSKQTNLSYILNIQQRRTALPWKMILKYFILTTSFLIPVQDIIHYCNFELKVFVLHFRQQVQIWIISYHSVIHS